MSLRQNGNILFIILLAVALLAALAYAVTNSLRGGGKDVSPEKAQTLAAQILQTGNLTANNLQRFMLVNNLVLGKVDMDWGGWIRHGDVDGCTTVSCSFFNPNGGGASIPTVPAAAVNAASSCTDFLSNGDVRAYNILISVDGLGTSAPELIHRYCAIKGNVCRAINIALGLQKEGDADINNNQGNIGNNDWTSYSGAMYPLPSVTAGRIGATDARVKGARAWCYYSGDDSIFYQVVAEQ